MESRLDLHESLTRDEEVQLPSERKFGLTFTVVFSLLTVLLIVWDNTAWPVSLAVALAFLGLTAFVPNWLRPLNRMWLRFGLALHAIVSPLILIVLFFVVITPVGVVARLAGKDFLRLKFDREATTYWIDRQPPGPSPQSMRTQF
jgi:Saxitoxin biosynthesis operon protein SxtJ